MAKARTAHVCGDCGAEYGKWQGQCTACGAWNTLGRVSLAPASSARSGGRASGGGFAGEAPAVRLLSEVGTEEAPRIPSGFTELDRVLGGGFVPGSVVLLGGDPGAGKSTLLLQTLGVLPGDVPSLYVTGEESLQQVALRARRLGVDPARIRVAAETRVEALQALVETHRPGVLIVDSVQVMHVDGVDSAPGGVTQVRESAAALTRLAKATGTVVVLVGHVTKDGAIAGPKILEHMIDAFLMLDGTEDARFRLLRGHKNRFGAVGELGVFAMTDKGLREVPNPSAIFLSRADEPSPGSVVTVTWEGTRPLLVELQALVDDAQGGHPRRIAIGLDSQRLVLQLAVLHRHGGIQVGDQDVFANVVGGVRLNDTGSDLALSLAVLSSLRSHVLPPDLVVFGEVGLSGEVRPVPNGQERLREAVKHGFRHAIVPSGNAPKKSPDGVRVHPVRTLGEAIEAVAGI